MGAVSGTFWLMTYSRSPEMVGDPAMNMGMCRDSSPCRHRNGEFEGLGRSGKLIDNVAVQVGGPKPGGGRHQVDELRRGRQCGEVNILGLQQVLMEKLDSVPSLFMV